LNIPLKTIGTDAKIKNLPEPTQRCGRTQTGLNLANSIDPNNLCHTGHRRKRDAAGQMTIARLDRRGTLEASEGGVRDHGRRLKGGDCRVSIRRTDKRHEASSISGWQAVDGACASLALAQAGAPVIGENGSKLFGNRRRGRGGAGRRLLGDPTVGSTFKTTPNIERRLGIGIANRLQPGLSIPFLKKANIISSPGV
jgi:hypothetical protein